MNISKKIKKAKFLIFDFDGTIADTSPIHEKAFQQVFKPFLITINYKEIAGKSSKDAVEFILKKNDINLTPNQVDELILKKQAIVREFLNSKAEFKALPFVKDFIESVHKFYSLGIASSGSRKTIEIALKRLNLYNYFHPILCSEDVKESKPSPEIFLKIIELANFSKEECLIFEDSQNGIEASKAASIPYLDVTVYPFSLILKRFKSSYE